MAGNTGRTTQNRNTTAGRSSTGDSSRSQRNSPGGERAGFDASATTTTDVGIAGSIDAGTTGSRGSSQSTGSSGAAASGSIGVEPGSAHATSQGSAATSRSSRGTTQASSRAEQEREVPIGRERQAQQQSSVQGSINASGGSGYATPFSFMRRFSEDMDRLFEEFGFYPPGLESQLSLLGFPVPGGRSSMSVNARPRQVSSGSSTTTGDTRNSALSRPSSSATVASRGASWMPQVEVLQRGNDLVVRADLPGLRRDDVHVHLDDGLLTVSGERRYESTEEEDGVYHSERSYGRFSRSIPLPEGIDAEACEAKFADGVLEVRVPLPAQQSRSRRIEVR
jgi:HSP20 family protein